MTRLLSVVSLVWLYCTIAELQPIQYLKSVFLEILNVTTWSVFQNKVTYKGCPQFTGGVLQLHSSNTTLFVYQLSALSQESVKVPFELPSG